MEFYQLSALREVIALPLFSDVVQCGFPSPALFPCGFCCQFAAKFKNSSINHCDIYFIRINHINFHVNNHQKMNRSYKH